MTFRSLLVVPQSVFPTEYDTGCLQRGRHRGRSQPSIIWADNTLCAVTGPVVRSADAPPFPTATPATGRRC